MKTGSIKDPIGDSCRHTLKTWSDGPMNNLPTEPGPYWWREKDGDEWEILLPVAKNNDGEPLWKPKKDGPVSLYAEEMGGQWQRCIPPDELATLRAQAEAYDMGQEAWAVFDGEVVLAVGDTKDRAIYKGKKTAGYTNPHCDMWPTMELRGYTCRKVKIVEVEE